MVSVKFPFGYQPDVAQSPERVLKPLSLAQATSTQIYHHGDVWMANIARLRRRQFLPHSVLLPVKMPLATRGAAHTAIDAAEEICEQVRQLNITIVSTDDRMALRAFVDIEQPGQLVLES
jgi:hypothetical protein